MGAEQSRVLSENILSENVFFNGKRHNVFFYQVAVMRDTVSSQKNIYIDIDLGTLFYLVSGEDQRKVYIPLKNNDPIIESIDWITSPLFYSKEYDISFAGLEKLHPFDSHKWGRVISFLKEKGFVSYNTVHREISDKQLLFVHTQEYLDSLQDGATLAEITEIPHVVAIPKPLRESFLLKKLRFQVMGTLMAAHYAMLRGIGINIGGGFHHCSSCQGGGFCAFADISLAIKILRKMYPELKVVIIDLDAHQGNGHARDKTNRIYGDPENTIILDIYNSQIFPQDSFAKDGIDIDCPLDPYTTDDSYLKELLYGLRRVYDDSTSRWKQLPDLVIYNAGTDVLEGDNLGCLSLTPEGVFKRDKMVFDACRRGIWHQGEQEILKPKNPQQTLVPLCMVTSGGYQPNNANIIAESILNLNEVYKFL